MTEFPLVLTLDNIFRYFDTFRSTTESPKIAGGYSRHRVSRHVQRACLTAGRIIKVERVVECRRTWLFKNCKALGSV